ncbi:MAG: BatD family protein [Bacteroidales bacterium]|nr:BatD family protein [Bacteroidales bacterium]
MINKIFCIVLFSFLFQTSFSQRATFEKKKITVGDQITLKLEIPENTGKDIKFPVFDKVIIPGIEIINKSDVKKTDDNFLEQLYTVTSFKDSLFLIKGFKFIVDGDTLETNPLRLKVSYFKPDSAFMSKIDTTQQLKIADIKSPVDAPLTLKEFMQRFGRYILLSIILIVIIVLIIKYVKKRKAEEKPLFVKAKPKIPAHIRAIQRINEIKNKELHKKNNLKPFYTELSNIIRIYLEERFKITALESVTNEIIKNFDKTEFANEDLNNKLKELLSLSDMVKFAKDEPDEYRNEMMIEYALSFVNKTKEEEKNEDELTDVTIEN